MPIVLLMMSYSNQLMAFFSLKMLDYRAAIFATALPSNASSDWPQKEVS